MIDLNKPLVINVTPTGSVPDKNHNVSVPISSEEIFLDVKNCYNAGGRVFHIHAREPDGTPSYRREIFADIIDRIRAGIPGAIICVSTTGRIFPDFSNRSQVLELEGDLKPDLASLTLGSLNFPNQASVNDPKVIQQLAIRMLERDIVPELEIFDFGMLDYAHYLIQKKVLQPPFVFNLLLGSLGTLAATGANLALLIERLPEGSFWSAAGIGRYQYSMNLLGITLGGHVRVGLEDNLYLDQAKSRPATNLDLVKRITMIADAVGRDIPTPDQARKLLGLNK